ncbi:MAG TPA: aminotransferase class V-fold PLP-dependent enzyme [Alphaproteobacteria bacterium]|jgi:selenocysteine lyase/cysteine desulfurase|nr:aminotransferase class V-fold PLP-dependent enzyme [Alphaproteobacteria bacterium]MDP6271822.1 aminotransferase class V-fold PLP-dependent enzyme [Alphaproteobacteria bacterium]HJM50074.1 aminotransferase class V-fold PLP-dependent enzyme [Alphaproteobacteria bacterium]
MTPQELRQHFPALNDKAYMNWASIGLIPEVAVAAGSAAMAEQARLGDGIVHEAKPMLDRLRQLTARLIGAEAGEVAFLRNTVEGVSTIASGFPWRSGDNVLVGTMEFPANVYPWLHAQRKGMEVRFVEPSQGTLSVDDFAAAADQHTRMIAISAVQFTNGYRIDLGALSEFCQGRDIRLAVDSIQALAIAPFDVSQTPIDYMAAGVHKWLCGPIGFGFFYVRKDRFDELELNEVGHGSHVRPGASWTEYDWPLRPDAGRFEAGALSFAHAAACEAALELFEETTVATIHDHATCLAQRLIEGLESKGYGPLSPQPARQAAGIVCFTSEHHSPESIEERLRDAGIFISLREGAVRVSIHGVNTSDEIDAVIAALPMDQ